MGDTIMALYTQSADDAVRGSIAVLEKLQHYNAGRARAGYVPISVGIGLNSGMVIIGTVGGANRMDSTVIGDAVNLASRIEEATKTYHVPLLISQNTLYDLADSKKYDIRFLDRIRVKGKSQPLSIYEVFDNDPADLREGKRAGKDLFEKAIAYYHLKKIAQAMELLTQCIQIAPYDVPAHIYLSRCEEFVEKGQHLTTGELNVLMEWQREFSIGIAEIDKSHECLFDKINDFILKIQQGDQSGIADILSFLAYHAQTRFKIEEELMELNKYLFTESHLQEHKRFIENIMELTQEAEAGTSDPHYLSFRTQLLVFDWFTGHIAKTDRHMGRHLLGAARSTSDKTSTV
jgi:hemerythrin